ncbi:hypothetical protein SCHPADRAFT_821618 [Schizopora paradoxa]|uniref:DASH complex subunit DAD1 n=1 Tax=Schizopora paradoxa TaxID=27342 RepID=A0A0H2RZS9_9AGAM|nr:hypothetical protein SCHPADRAFT_821618 [Schizopora paradoxa]
MPDEEPTFFDKERDRLAGEIAAGFESLLSQSNVFNRKMEEVLGMTKEYDTIASLWSRFHLLMRGQGEGVEDEETSMVVGLPGTGSHIPSSKKDETITL